MYQVHLFLLYPKKNTYTPPIWMDNCNSQNGTMNLNITTLLNNSYFGQVFNKINLIQSFLCVLCVTLRVRCG